MKKKNKRKTGLIAIMLILIMLISIGYATISTNLTIGGNATITAQNWLVYFDHIQTTTGSVTPTTAPTTSGTSTTTLTWAVTLDTPGQFYEYTVDVVNAGSIDAMIGTLSNSTLTTDQAKYLDYTVTYSDGAEIEQYDKLDAGTTETLRVRVEFKSDPEELPATASAITLNYASNYIQADTTHAKARNTVSQPASLEIGDTVAYTTTLNGETLNNWKVFYNDETNGKVYLIYGDYLPYAAIPNMGEDVEKWPADEEDDEHGTPYASVNSQSSGTDLVDGLLNKQAYDSLLTGTLNGTTTVNLSRSNDVWAMSTPTIDLFAESWNAKYPSDQITYSYDSESGYLNAMYINLSETAGYSNTLYFPHTTTKPSEYGYWLASGPTTFDSDAIVYVEERGYIKSYYCNLGKAIRPVICLPSNLF